MKKLILYSLLAFVGIIPALAQIDAQIKAALLGYWRSPRHDYLIQADGLMRMCPTTGPDPATTVSHWDVRNGVFYETFYQVDSIEHAYKITAINKRQFVSKGLRGDDAGVVFTLHRISRAEAESQ